MSSPNQPNRAALAMAIAVGAVVVYGMIRGPGSGASNVATDSVLVTSEMMSTTTIPTGVVLHADEQVFQQLVLESQEPMLVDFYADWCGPCRQLAPTLERVAADTTDGRIVKINVDHSPGLASRYGIRSIPTLLLFVDGEVVTRTSGVRSEQELRRLLTGGES